MRCSTQHLRAPMLLAGLALILAGCEQGPTDAAPPAPRFDAAPKTCDFVAAKQALKSWFPGSGPGSSETLANAKLDAAKAACEAGQSAQYTGLVGDIGYLIEQVLEGRNPQGEGGPGDAADANTLLQQLFTMRGPSQTVIYLPCGAVPAPDCVSWEGFDSNAPFSNPPDFTKALSDDDGLFAVIGPADGNAATVDLSSDDAVCSGVRVGDRSPCAGIPGTGDVWGYSPVNSWTLTLRGIRSIMYGAPTDATPPTGEALLDADLPAYHASLSPRQIFPEGEELVGGLCTLDDAADPANDAVVIQRNNVGTQRGSIFDWCGHGKVITRGQSKGIVGRLASLARAILVPRPLYADFAVTNAVGGTFGATSDFFATVMNKAAVVEFVTQPVGGVAGDEIVDANGAPVRIRTRTNKSTPLEKVLITITAATQNANSTSGLVLVSSELDNCTATDSDPQSCTTETAGDASVDPPPGHADLTDLTIDKTGQHRLCVTAALSPFTFNSGLEVCSDPFVQVPN